MITLLLTLWASLRGVSEALRTVARLHIVEWTQATQANRWFDSFWFSFGYCQSVSSLQLIIFHNLRFDLPRILLSTISDESPDDSSASWKLHISEIFVISVCNICRWFRPTRGSLLLLLHMFIININCSWPGNQRSRIFPLWTEIIILKK